MKHTNNMLLDDINFFTQEKSARTFTIFANHSNFKKIPKQVINDLESRAISLNTNARICMHEKGDACISEMIIAQHRHSYFPPKLRFDTDISFTILSGSLGVYVFDNFGRVIDYSIINGSDSPYCRVAKGCFHIDVPITPISVHLEVVSGITKNLSDLYHPLWYRPEERLGFLKSLPLE